MKKQQTKIMVSCMLISKCAALSPVEFCSVIVVSRSSRFLVSFVSSYNLLEVVPWFCKSTSHSAVG